MFHAIRLVKVVYISLLAFSTRPLLSSSSVENTQKPATMNSNKSTKEARNMTRAHHRYTQRRALAISEYLLLAAPLQHMEATKFIAELEEKYTPQKDIRKTPEFRAWQREQLGIKNRKSTKRAAKKTTRGGIQQKKEMVLNVRLLNTTVRQEIPQQTPTTVRQEIPQQTPTTVRQEIPQQTPTTRRQETPHPTPSVNPEAEECGITNIFDEIPEQVMNRLRKDINEDPFLKSILDEFDVHEEIIDEGNFSDIDIDIDHLIPLDEELNKLF